MLRNLDLFAGTEFDKPGRRKARTKAHVVDAGERVIMFECGNCGWNSGWIDHDMSVSEAKKGIPCKKCNQ